MVNIPLTAGFPYHAEDLFVPKKYVVAESGLASQPVIATPRRKKSSASALMPAPAMPTK